MGQKMLPPLREKMKRMSFEETDNMVWSGVEKEIAQWCRKDVVYDEITEEEIEEIWRREDSSDDETIRLNGKYVWELPSACATSSTHTRTSSASLRLVNTEL